jgi:hypothetical protein
MFNPFCSRICKFLCILGVYLFYGFSFVFELFLGQIRILGSVYGQTKNLKTSQLGQPSQVDLIRSN